VRTPFDGHIEEKIRETIRTVIRRSGLDSLPERPYAPIPEVINVQAKDKKAVARQAMNKRESLWQFFT
jgi:hypothetical protein